ncbi:MAG TPA: tRNA pseudouridine(55) synthase, partial [Candidatus Dojkabacteria bacterium]|nr:tRNA pseudouridine(55) synthase [Candidatus Dojkabacteria bacterium]
LDYNWPFVTFKILCSSGTYVRTLINDLGIQSGAYATAVELRRFKIGNYLSERAFKSEEISEGNIDRILNSIINLNNK